MLMNPLQVENWDELVMRFPSHCIFHSRSWAQVLQDTYGFKPVYFALKQDREIQALLPVMEADTWLTRRRGVSLPFTDFCPPLAKSPESYSAVVQEAIRQGKRRHWRYLEFRGGLAKATKPPASISFYAHRLNLSEDVEGLFASFKPELRTAIRKARRQGVKIERSNTQDALHTFYALHCKTRRRHGIPPQPFTFFRNIHRQILAKDMGLIVLGTLKSRTVAAAMFFHFGKRALFKFGASEGSGWPARANNLVMWEAIQWYARNGFESLHFGRTSLAHEGLRRFKRGWGAEEEELAYFRYDLGLDTYVSGKDRVGGWHNSVFRFMPLPLSRLLGKFAYQHLD